MRFGARVLALGTFALLGGCDDVVRWTLPAPPENVDLGFGVLYRGNAPVQVGPVVAPSVIYAGDYTLLDSDADLEARLYFFEAEALISAALRTCEAEPVAIDRRRCVAAAERCRSTLQACLAPGRIDVGCGDRLQLPDDMPIVAMQGPGGILRARPATAQSIEGLAMCGPIVRPPCPNLLPGFLVTDDDGFVCAAPTAQDGCRLDVDLTGCGLGIMRGDVGPSGALRAREGVCRVDAMSPPAIVGDGPAYALTCGELSLVATVMGEVLTESGCERSGPANYETDTTFGGPQTGRIVGLVPIRPEGWPDRWVMTGTGQDRCSIEGCLARGIDCGVRCEDACESFEVRYCAFPVWPACTGLNRRALCKERCQAACQQAATDSGGCFDIAEDAIVTTSDPRAPEQLLGRFNLVDDRRGPIGDRGLVGLGPHNAPTLVAVGRSRLHAFQPRAVADQLTRTSTLAVDATLNGAVATDDADDALISFGIDANGAAVWHRIEVIDGRLTEAARFSAPDLDRIALAASSASRVYLTDGSRLLVAEPTTGQTRSIPLPSAPSDIVALPGGGALLSVPSAEGGMFGRMAPSAADPDWVPGIPGLRPVALAVDPARCDAAECLIWVAYEPASRIGRTMVGRLTTRGVDVIVAPALSATPLDQVGRAYVDPFVDAVVLVSTARNQLVSLPIALPEPR